MLDIHRLGNLSTIGRGNFTPQLLLIYLFIYLSIYLFNIDFAIKISDKNERRFDLGAPLRGHFQAQVKIYKICIRYIPL